MALTKKELLEPQINQAYNPRGGGGEIFFFSQGRPGWLGWERCFVALRNYAEFLGNCLIFTEVTQADLCSCKPGFTGFSSPTPTLALIHRKIEKNQHCPCRFCRRVQRAELFLLQLLDPSTSLTTPADCTGFSPLSTTLGVSCGSGAAALSPRKPQPLKQGERGGDLFVQLSFPPELLLTSGARD